jgi:hypothetical protein
VERVAGDAMMKTIKELEEDRNDLQQTSDLSCKADMRAIKRWQAATGKELVWPDRTDMVVWLLNRIDALEVDVANLIKAHHVMNGQAQKRIKELSHVEGCHIATILRRDTTIKELETDNDALSDLVATQETFIDRGWNTRKPCL